MRIILFLFLLFVSVPFSAFAWPKAHGVYDLNGDCRVEITVLGDSIVRGLIGNGELVYDRGYADRASSRFPHIRISGVGENGQTTRQLYRKVRSGLRKAPRTSFSKLLYAADAIVFDIGRNDRWERSPEAAVRTIERIGRLIMKKNKVRLGVPPLIVYSTLLIPNRGSQSPWVKSFNTIVKAKAKRQKKALVRFDTISKAFLGKDNLHPTSDGYAKISDELSEFIRKVLPRKSEKMVVDSDGDGLQDGVEEKLPEFDPFLYDTNANARTDGEERCG